MTGPRWLVAGEPGWPSGFAHLQHPPDGIWLWGAEVPKTPAVAVVGARKATFSGLDVARCLGRDLAEAGVQVVSGMALGIDGAAHRGALDGGGSTVAVLGCGIDVCYPRRHRDLRDEILAGGCVISEEARDAAPLKPQFPKRNRLIAAMACAVVVVEASARSGALSTARWAVDLGREVLAVPGSIRSPVSEGTNLLIRDGARPFLSIDDLFEAAPELAGAGVAGAGSPGTSKQIELRLSLPLREILGRMGTDPVHPDVVGSELGLPAAVVAARLGALELVGAVMSLPGGLVARTISR
jgi:DNA processing protein